MTNRRQWSGVPVPTRGQQNFHNTAHRYDLLGPFTVSASGSMTWASGAAFYLPAGCLLLEIYCGSVAGGTITIHNWGPLVVPASGMAGVLSIGRMPAGVVGQADEVNAILEPTQPFATLDSGGPFTVWFSILRWAGTS